MKKKDESKSKWTSIADKSGDTHQAIFKSLIEYFPEGKWLPAAHFLEDKELDASKLFKFARDEADNFMWLPNSTILHILAYYKTRLITENEKEYFYKLAVALQKKGADVNAIGDGNNTVLMNAISQDNEVYFDWLLKNGVKNLNHYNEDAVDKETCALALAIASDNLTYVKKLLLLPGLEIDSRTVEFAIDSGSKYASELYRRVTEKLNQKIVKQEEELQRLNSQISRLQVDVVKLGIK